MPGPTFTELYPGVGGSKMDERLVPNAPAGGEAHRSVAIPGGAAGEVQSFRDDAGTVKAQVVDENLAVLIAALIAAVQGPTVRQERVDDQNTIVYAGYAALGAATNAAAWRIRKSTLSAEGIIELVQWSAANVSWDNRESEDYS